MSYQRADLNEGGIELPVLIMDASGDRHPLGWRGFYFSFKGADEVVIEDFAGPYSTREAALTAAQNVAHEAVRAQATEDLLSQNQGH